MKPIDPKLKRWLPFFVLLMLASIAYSFTAQTTKATITGKKGEITLKLEVAKTEAERQRGLMKRKMLKPYDGMAFFFPTVAPQKFWMKNTPLPLDIMFVDEAGKIVAIAAGKPLSEEPVGPNSKVATVIEIDGGRAAKDGIAIGDKVTYDIQGSPQALAR